MRVVVDLNRCQGYAQCVFLAPDVFQLRGEEALHLRPQPGRCRAPAGPARRGGLPGAGDPRGAAGRDGGGRSGMSIDAAVAALVEDSRPAAGSSSSAPRWPGCAPPRRCARRASGAADHHRRRAVRAVRSPAAVEAGPARVGAGRPHRSCRAGGGRRASGGSGWRRPDWIGPPGRCSWPTASRSATTAC